MYTIKKLGDGKESGSGEKGTRCQERKRKKFFESDYQARSQEIKKSIYFIRFLDIGPRVSDRAKKTCLLIGSWEEIEGDKLIIESLYGNSYDRFLEEVLPYAKGEDPLLYMIKRNGSISYYLASAENIWSYLNVLTNEKIWQSFVTAAYEVINESENLFTYDSHERLIAQFKDEKLFWSETMRKGMLKTLLIKSAYQNDEETQLTLNRWTSKVLDCVKTEKQWIYISKFWRELCEISPEATLERLENELNEDTGLLCLFQNQSSDFFFGRNAYIDVLWGIEQFLCQREYFWRAFRWLLKLDACYFEYKSNSPKDIFSKIFCIWMNFSSLRTAKEKLAAAEIAFDIDYNNIWEYLYSVINNSRRSMVGELSPPKYREYEKAQPATIAEMRKAHLGYFELLIKHMNFSVDRWKKMIDLTDELPQELRKNVFEQLLYELSQMSDEEVMRIKNKIRHLIYKDRYFSSSDWSMPEEIIAEYEKLLDKINIKTIEYEYSYLFINNHDYPLLHPIPYKQRGESDDNESATQELIRDKLVEFQSYGYDLTVLAKVCAQESFSTLGYYLAKYWNDGKWDFATFKKLLAVQVSGTIAIDYLRNIGSSDVKLCDTIIEDLSNNSCSTEILAEVYKIEGQITKEIPLVTFASEEIKKEFWKKCFYCDDHSKFWALAECKKYATLAVYLDQVHLIHYRNPLSAEQIFECFEDIESMPHSEGNQLTSYHVKQLIGVIQEAYINDPQKCIRIAHLEIIFMNFLDWKNMKCFCHIIKQSSELFAQLVEVVFKKDHSTVENHSKDQAYIHNMYTIYEKARFCPTESNGEVSEEQLEQWIEKYRQLLLENHQESLFETTLGRLFSFSPVGTDGHEPCEAVRKMIEKYGDEKMNRAYQVAVYNRRGVFSPSAGKEELRMAKEFKENAQYLESSYPKTAKIFYGLYETYKKDSERERKDAENGWY